jgi:quinol-cytochrome oxidoreductase complex cytochrome b subunit
LSPELPNDALQNPTRKQRLLAFFVERLGIDAALALAAKKHVPIHRTTIFYFLGGMALFLFGIQVATGILLSLYYKPSPDQAFESVRAIMTEVDFGWLIRSLHVWSANLLIGVLFLHILTTYMMRAYRGPREFTWITGVLLLSLFLAFGFSGYLLPWNQLAFFATRVGTAITGVIPVVGEDLLLMARSGENVTGDTLARFYALHVVILPLCVFALLGLHLFLVQKHGMSVPEGAVGPYGSAEKVPSMPFVPHFLLRDMVGWYVALGILAALAALFPWELGQKADTFGATPEGIKPEWYFLFMFQALKQLPAYLFGGQTPAGPLDIEGELAGILFFGFSGLVVLVAPLLDRGNCSRRTLSALAAVAVAFFIVMTAWGWFAYPEGAAPEVVRQTLLLRVIMGSALSFGVLLLTLPFLERGSAARRGIMVLLALLAALLIVSTAWTAWEMLA